MELKYKNIDSKITVEKGAGSPVIEGYFVIFNEPDLDKDRFLPGSIRVPKGVTPKLLYNHSARQPLGKTIIRRDEKGASFKSEIVATSYSNDVVSLVRAGVLGVSFGFAPQEFEPNDIGGFDFKKVDVYEVSLATFPAQVKNSVEIVKNKLNNINYMEKLNKIEEIINNLQKQVDNLLEFQKTLAPKLMEEGQKVKDLESRLKQAEELIQKWRDDDDAMADKMKSIIDSVVKITKLNK